MLGCRESCWLANLPFFYSFQYYFTISFTHENQKALELRTEDVKDCDEWVAAISHARYSRCARSRCGFIKIMKDERTLLIL